MSAPGSVFVISLAGAPVGDGKASLCDVLAQPWGEQYFQAKLASAKPWTATTGNDEREPSLECLADVEPRNVEYISKPRLPLGMISGIEGNPGEGKTFVCLSAAADGSRGKEPFTGLKCEPFSTVYLSNENLLAAVTKPKFIAMGGDEKRFFALNGAVNSDGSQAGITLADIPILEKAMLKTHAKLLIIDPLQSYMGASVDSHKANETRPLLDGLARLAERLNICIVIVRHLAKGGASRAIFAGLGSIDIAGAMRSVMMVGTAPDDPQNRALVHTKPAAGMLAPSLRFSIEGKDVNAKVVWRGQSELTGADLMAPQGKAKTEITKATEFLREQLKSGPKLQTELVTNEFSPNTLQRASARIGVRKTRRKLPGKGAQGPWEWALPKFARQAAAMGAAAGGGE